MKTCKSAGIDKISVKLIQTAGKTILSSLKNIFNLSLNTGMFPDDKKIAHGPISIKSNVAQIFEKAVYSH